VYFVTVSMSVSCVGSDSFFVHENLSPIPIITGNPLICPQVPAFIDVGTGYTSYQWSTGDTIQAINITSENSYSVSVTDTNGCVGSTSMLVKNNNGPILTSNTQNEICGRANGSALINASGGLGIYSYLWSNGATLPLDSGLTQGIYSVSVSDGNCSVSSNVIVNETHGPIANFYVQPSPLVLFEKSVTANFYDCSTGSVGDWFWNFGDTTNTATGNQVIHDYYNIGYYPITLIVSDTNGCIDTLIRKILVRDYFTCYIPNCFTPSSNDEINNWFSPKGANWQSKDFEMYIFDRWGDMLFQSKDVTNTSWNGTFNNTGSPSDAVMGVYQYLIRIREDSNTLHEYIGSVTLLK
jgi:gliding motility-associated-like protein